MTDLIFKQEIENEVLHNILRFWIDNAKDNNFYGFYGYIDNNMTVDKYADKAVVICARILWTFSKAYLMFKKEEYLDAANWAYKCLISYFYDHENQGVFWRTNYKGDVVDCKKQVYAQAFAIYGLSEFHLATNDRKPIEYAHHLFNVIEDKCKDKHLGGYFEAFSKEWTSLEDVRLSDKDLNAPKTMNTHLHILEAYTNLYKATADEKVKTALRYVLQICLDKIIDNNSGHMQLFFTEAWESVDNVISYGHDIEGSWLMIEAADLVADEVLKEKTRKISLSLVHNCYKLGVDLKNGSMYDHVKNGVSLSEGTEWWTYAEAIVGFYNAYILTKKKEYHDTAILVWKFIKHNIIDYQNGEWFASISRDGKKILNSKKIYDWKCPYHNSRMCFKILKMMDNKM